MNTGASFILDKSFLWNPARAPFLMTVFKQFVNSLKFFVIHSCESCEIDWRNCKLDRKCTFHEVCKSLILRTSYTTISFQPWTKSSIFCLFQENLQEVCYWQLKADRQKFTSAISLILKTFHTQILLSRSNPCLIFIFVEKSKIYKKALKVHSAWPTHRSPKLIVRKRPS